MRRGRTALALAVAGLAATPAAALADLEVAVQPNEARFGDAHHVQGRLTDAQGAPAPGQVISLQERDFPYTGRFRTIGHATTAADGSFKLDDVELERNADLRAVAFSGETSGIARAFTYPAFTLRYKAIGANTIRLLQDYRTPRAVRLRAPTLFYLASGKSSVSTRRVKATTRRTAAGRFRAVATVRLPKSWKGTFRYASCFGYSSGSGMGDPARGCAKTFTF